MTKQLIIVRDAKRSVSRRLQQIEALEFSGAYEMNCVKLVPDSDFDEDTLGIKLSGKLFSQRYHGIQARN